MSTQHQVIEHIVLINVKPDVDSTKVAAMINEANGLASLDLSIHFIAGELLRSTTSSLTFSHIFYCRFRSKEDLQVYFDHPEHLRVVTEKVQPLIDDILVVDWISSGISDSPKPGSAIRVKLLTLKEDLIEDDKSKLVVEVLQGMKSRYKATEHISFGENFSHVMAKGYSIAIVTVFPVRADLESLDSDAEPVNANVNDSIASELVADYVFILPKVANH